MLVIFNFILITYQNRNHPPEIPSKNKSTQNIPANLYRSTSVISSHSIDSGVSKRKSKPSDWFSNNFGGSTASLQDKQPPPAIELKEEVCLYFLINFLVFNKDYEIFYKIYVSWSLDTVFFVYVIRQTYFFTSRFLACYI